jgi:acetyl-CoA synthetase
MTRLPEFRSYADAHAHFSNAALWDLFDGTRDRINIAHECIDRHAGGDAVAIRIAELSRRSSQTAHFLTARGLVKGDRVAVMLEPSLAFYSAMFGAMKAGMVVAPMFILFGPDGIRLRVGDCSPEVFFTNAEQSAEAEGGGAKGVIVLDDGLLASISDLPGIFDWDTGGDDLAALQYT